jgi:5-methylthioadenosine/S-adenosylhomocysteine deaminase
VGRLQEQRVDGFWQPEDVLRMATIDGARAMGLDAEIGSLEAGKRADLVVLDFRRPHLVPCLDPVGNLVHVAQGRDVEHVWVDGVQTVASGAPALASIDAVLRDAQAAADALWRRARAA